MGTRGYSQLALQIKNYNLFWNADCRAVQLLANKRTEEKLLGLDYNKNDI